MLSGVAYVRSYAGARAPRRRRAGLRGRGAFFYHSWVWDPIARAFYLRYLCPCSGRAGFGFHGCASVKIPEDVYITAITSEEPSLSPKSSYTRKHSHMCAVLDQIPLWLSTAILRFYA